MSAVEAAPTQARLAKCTVRESGGSLSKSLHAQDQHPRLVERMPHLGAYHPGSIRTSTAFGPERRAQLRRYLRLLHGWLPGRPDLWSNVR
jgi:hypothetical protein